MRQRASRVPGRLTAINGGGGHVLPIDCKQLRDWRVGTHGKRVGNWEGGEKTYYLCVNCHNPHQPGIPGREPAPGASEPPAGPSAGA